MLRLLVEEEPKIYYGGVYLRSPCSKFTLLLLSHSTIECLINSNHCIIFPKNNFTNYRIQDSLGYHYI